MAYETDKQNNIYFQLEVKLGTVCHQNNTDYAVYCTNDCNFKSKHLCTNADYY